MILTSPERIRDYVVRGFWGTTTIDDLFRTAVISGRDRLAIVDAPNKASFMNTPVLRLSWNEIADNVDRLCQRLLAAGVKRDDIIGTQLPNCVELAYLYLAAARLGFILSPFPSQYREHELRDLISFAGVSGFITARSIRGHDHAAMVNGLRGDLPKLRFVLAWGGPSSDGITTLDDLEHTEPDRGLVAEAARKAAVTANDIVTITWTSGTEARPKGVPRNHNYWICAGTAVGQAGLLKDGDALLNPFPMVHLGSLGGMFFPWLIWRGVLVQHQPFELDVFLKQIQDEKINYTVAPPAVLNLLMQNDALRNKYDLTSLRSVGSGSAPLSPWMIRAFQDQYNISVWNSFGSSEGCGLFGSGRDVPRTRKRAPPICRASASAESSGRHGRRASRRRGWSIRRPRPSSPSVASPVNCACAARWCSTSTGTHRSRPGRRSMRRDSTRPAMSSNWPERATCRAIISMSGGAPR